MRITTCLFVALLTLLAGCTEPSTKTAKSDAAKSDAAKTDAAKTAAAKTAAATDAPAAPGEAVVYDVKCGCAIKAVGHCGEYAMIDGKHVEITDHGMGSMPFCGKGTLKAKITGAVVEGKLKASAIEMVK